MNRHYTALTVEGTTPPAANVSARPVNAAIFGIVVAFAALLWIVSVAPTLASFTLAVATATAWCVWLDRHPAGAAGREQRADVASSRVRVVATEREKHSWDRA